MIFITVGSQKFEFNRLLKNVDELIEEGVINEEVFAQTGNSSYIPKNYKYTNFINNDEFKSYISKARFVISHAGAGTIIKCVKNNIPIIVVPRYQKFNEHVDDHQLQITKAFENIIIPVSDTDSLREAILKVDITRNVKYESNTKMIIKSIDEYIESEFCEE